MEKQQEPRRRLEQEKSRRNQQGKEEEWRQNIKVSYWYEEQVALLKQVAGVGGNQETSWGKEMERNKQGRSKHSRENINSKLLLQVNYLK